MFAPTISFGWIARGTVDAVLGIAHRRLILFVWDCARMYNGDGRDESPRRKSWRVCLLHQTHGFGLFHEQGHERFALVGHLIVEHGILQGLF